MQRVTVKERNELEKIFLLSCKRDSKFREIYNFILKKIGLKR